MEGGTPGVAWYKVSGTILGVEGSAVLLSAQSVQGVILCRIASMTVKCFRPFLRVQFFVLSRNNPAISVA